MWPLPYPNVFRRVQDAGKSKILGGCGWTHCGISDPHGFTFGFTHTTDLANPTLILLTLSPRYASIYYAKVAGSGGIPSLT